jgi:hypothetical protein
MSKEKILRIGLGEAVSRLMSLELSRSNRLHPFPEEAIKEREMLYLALNEIKIDLGFDCDGDGLPDSVEIFEQSAKSSCCRIVQSKDSNPIKTKIERADFQKGIVSKTKPKEDIKKERKNRSSRKKKSK